VNIIPDEFRKEKRIRKNDVPEENYEDIAAAQGDGARLLHRVQHEH
jgi:hypothetical protein